MRAALLACLCWLGAAPLAAQTIQAARFAEPTDRYPHGVLGDDIEHGALAVTLGPAPGRTHLLRLPPDLVFEDTAPRLVDLDGDGAPEVLTVESHQTLGARVAVYGMVSGEPRRVAWSTHIGQRFRWLAIVGAADLDGDGRTEIAFIDRPHLARVLRILRFAPGRMAPVASLEGLTNHRIGERDIAGGIRDCDGQGPELVLATADWRALAGVRLTPDGLAARPLGPHEDRASFAAALACR